MAKCAIERYRRERDEQALRRQDVEAELLRVTKERDDANEERQFMRDEIERLRSEIERKEAALREAEEGLLFAIACQSAKLKAWHKSSGRLALAAVRAALSPAEEGKNQEAPTISEVCGLPPKTGEKEER